MMKLVFYILLALWIGGGIIGGIVGGQGGQAFFVNVFGIPAIILGIILLVRKVMNRDKATEPQSSQETSDKGRDDEQR